MSSVCLDTKSDQLSTSNHLIFDHNRIEFYLDFVCLWKEQSLDEILKPFIWHARLMGVNFGTLWPNGNWKSGRFQVMSL